MTLFHGLGILIGIPLSKALGRRPIVVIAAAITCLSILWAGLAGTFAELLVSVSFQALAAGFVTGMVCATHGRIAQVLTTSRSF